MMKIENFEGPKIHVQETKETERGHGKPLTKPKQQPQNVFSLWHADLRVKNQHRNMFIPQIKKCQKSTILGKINVIFCFQETAENKNEIVYIVVLLDT